MGTKKIGTMTLVALSERSKTFSEVRKSLAENGLKCASEDLEKSIIRLKRLGFITASREKAMNRYSLTALGQAVIENTK